jgi:CcmD family protein
MSNVEFLAVGYGVVWVIIAAYVWFVSHRQAAARHQLDELQAEMNEAAEKLAQQR